MRRHSRCCIFQIATAWDGLVAASGESVHQMLPHKHLVALAPIRVATTGCGSVSMAVCASGKLYCWGTVLFRHNVRFGFEWFYCLSVCAFGER
jgi:hypothetical protein